MSNPIFSIIIPTYNSENMLSLCLASIKRQTCKNIDVIVVDNFSNDSTREIADGYGASVLLKGSERSAPEELWS